MSIAIKVFPDTYIDSVVQLRGMRAMREISGRRMGQRRDGDTREPRDASR